MSDEKSNRNKLAAVAMGLLLLYILKKASEKEQKEEEVIVPIVTPDSSPIVPTNPPVVIGDDPSPPDNPIPPGFLPSVIGGLNFASKTFLVALTVGAISKMLENTIIFYTTGIVKSTISLSSEGIRRSFIFLRDKIYQVPPVTIDYLKIIENLKINLIQNMNSYKFNNLVNNARKDIIINADAKLEELGKELEKISDDYERIKDEGSELEKTVNKQKFDEEKERLQDEMSNTAKNRDRINLWLDKLLEKKPSLRDPMIFNVRSNRFGRPGVYVGNRFENQESGRVFVPLRGNTEIVLDIADINKKTEELFDELVSVETLVQLPRGVSTLLEKNISYGLIAENKIPQLLKYENLQQTINLQNLINDNIRIFSLALNKIKTEFQQRFENKPYPGEIINQLYELNDFIETLKKIDVKSADKKAVIKTIEEFSFKFLNEGMTIKEFFSLNRSFISTAKEPKSEEEILEKANKIIKDEEKKISEEKEEIIEQNIPADPPRQRYELDFLEEVYNMPSEPNNRPIGFYPTQMTDFTSVVVLGKLENIYSRYLILNTKILNGEIELIDVLDEYEGLYNEFDYIINTEELSNVKPKKYYYMQQQFLKIVEIKKLMNLYYISQPAIQKVSKGDIEIELRESTKNMTIEQLLDFLKMRIESFKEVKEEEDPLEYQRLNQLKLEQIQKENKARLERENEIRLEKERIRARQRSLPNILTPRLFNFEETRKIQSQPDMYYEPDEIKPKIIFNNEEIYYDYEDMSFYEKEIEHPFLLEPNFVLPPEEILSEETSTLPPPQTALNLEIIDKPIIENNIKMDYEEFDISENVREVPNTPNPAHGIIVSKLPIEILKKIIDLKKNDGVELNNLENELTMAVVNLKSGVKGAKQAFLNLFNRFFALFDNNGNQQGNLGDVMALIYPNNYRIIRELSLNPSSFVRTFSNKASVEKYREFAIILQNTLNILNQFLNTI